MDQQIHDIKMILLYVMQRQDGKPLSDAEMLIIRKSLERLNLSL